MNIRHGGGTCWIDAEKSRQIEGFSGCEFPDTHYLIVGGYGYFASIPWPVPVGESAVFSAVPPLEGGAHFCGLSAEDMDGDGKDELVTAYYLDRPGLSLYSGDPINGFNLLAQTHDVPVDPAVGISIPQWIASFEDLDGDGLKDLVATNPAGGVDAVFMNRDGSAEVHRELVPIHEFSLASTAARLGSQRTPYVLVRTVSGHSVFRIVDRSTAAEEPWRIPAWTTEVYNRPLLVMDADGDGLPDLVGNDAYFYVGLWRRPREDERAGLIGPRRLEFGIRNMP